MDEAKKRQRAGITTLRDGSRTTTILMRCSPKLKKQVQAVARKLGVSIGRALEELATAQLKTTK